MPSVLLFVDMLGVRASWQRGGRNEAEKMFKDFRSLIAAALKGKTEEEVLDGFIETDAAVIDCRDAGVALEVGRHLYRMAFRQTATSRAHRPWLRGVIVPRVSSLPLRKQTTLRAPLGQVKLMLYQSELFDAVAIEKSGIKGMRIIVDRSLLTPEINRQFKITVGRFSFIPFKRLHSGRYPSQITETHVDFLWMACTEPEERFDFERIMHLRTRLASADFEEFSQAAATQVAFFENEAMMGSLEARQKYQDLRKARKVKVP